MTREDEIFEKLKNGDESGAAELVGMYYEDILRYRMFRLPDRYLAEDAVQETFLKVFRYFDDYRHKGRFRAFLYKVAGNTCIDMMRKKQWDPIPEDAAQEESGMRKTEEQEDFLRALPEGTQDALHTAPVTDMLGNVIPLSELGFGWIVPAAVGFVIGLIASSRRGA